ncbi:MAG: xanthine dehydrogenase small subunit [Rhodobacterales bacterium]|nr:xanthine dehydrogenase small subunit [Rhodobacterales bacterium]
MQFVLNGRVVQIPENLSPTTTLLQFLREHRQLTGTKEGCAEGDCGACTVVIWDSKQGWRAINACLLLIPMVAGKRVQTVEGLQTDGKLHPVQEAMVRNMGSQCGFCTPGFVMTLFEACYREDLDDSSKLDDQIAGNLCRCTGYRPIQQAAKEVAGLQPTDRFTSPGDDVDTHLDQITAHQAWFAPTRWETLFALLRANKEARIIAGGTDLGLDVTQKHVAFPCLISVEQLPGIQSIVRDNNAWSIGAGAALTDVESWAADHLPMLARMLRFFGARQIKHRATVGGNLCNASPIGDLAPVLLALDATVILAGPDGERRLPLRDFFLDYRQTALKPSELLARVLVPDLAPSDKVGTYKVSRRRELDISQVSGGFWVQLDENGVVTDARMGFGGMAATPARATGLEQALRGRPWTPEGISSALAALAEDFTPMDDARASAWYRTKVAENLVRGFVEETQNCQFAALSDRPMSTFAEGTSHD